MGINEVNNNKQNPQVVQPGTTPRELARLTEQINKIQSPEKLKEETISRFLDRTREDRGTAIVSNAVASFAKSTIGKIFKETMKIKVHDTELNEAKLLGEEETEDSVRLTPNTHISEMQKQLKLIKNAQEQNQTQAQQLDSETQAMVQQYTQLYGQLITSRSDLVSKELEKLEKKLKASGYTSDQLFNLKLSIKTSMRMAVMNQIKDAFLKRTVSLDMVVEYGTAERGLNDILNELIGNQKLGATDFGGYRGDLQGAVNNATEEVCREVRLALQEMLNQKMTERLVSNNVEPKQVREELAGLLKIGGRVGFEPGEYMKSWYKEKIDQGLFIFNRPDMPAQLQNQLSDQSKQRDQQDNSAELSSEQTEEFLINRMRALYIRAALKDDLRTSLDTAFKMIKTKNQMIKLGIFSNDVNDKVKQQAQLIAAGKTLEMLREAYMERATLYKLAGPAFKLIEAKTTGLMRNAAKLGMDLGDYELTLIRDRANETVFELATRELKLTVMSQGIKDTPIIRDKKKKLVMLLERLKEESGIKDEIELSQNELVDRVQVEK